MAPDYKTYKTTGGRSYGLTFTTYLRDGSTWKPLMLDVNIDRYIINENATILFWDDETKTISKRHKEDKFDKELGFLFAYFYKKYKGSKASRKRVIDSIDYKKIKIFLFEFFVNHSEYDRKEAKIYLSNLQVSK